VDPRYTDIIAAARGLPCSGCPAKTTDARFHDGKGRKPEAKQPATDATSIAKAKAQQQACFDKCGGTERGGIECKLGSDGMPSAEVETTIRETDPCTRPCVEKHEAVHAGDIAPTCRTVAACLKQAGNDRAKQDKCLDAWQASQYAIILGAECKAYSAELDCMEQRKTTKACKDGDGAKHWREALDRTHCYHDCFCAKPT
jgi:hypothetical protein